MTYHEERRAAYEATLPTLEAIARALGGTLCSLLEAPPISPDARGHHIPHDSYIHLPGELFALSLSPSWRDRSKLTARLVIPRQHQDPITIHHRSNSPQFSLARPPAALAGDIRRRVIDHQRPAAIDAHRAQLERARDTAEKESFLDDLARLLQVPSLRNSRGGGGSEYWTAPGFEVGDYDLKKAQKGAPLHCTIRVPLHAFRLIAPIIAAAQPPPRQE